jgi:hypothetical protein
VESNINLNRNSIGDLLAFDLAKFKEQNGDSAMSRKSRNKSTSGLTSPCLSRFGFRQVAYRHNVRRVRLTRKHRNRVWIFEPSQCFIQAFARGGAMPPRAKRWAPRGNLTNNFLLRRCPAKPPRGEALSPPGKISRGGPTLKILEALTETRSQCSAAGRRLECWRRIKWQS